MPPNLSGEGTRRYDMVNGLQLLLAQEAVVRRVKVMTESLACSPMPSRTMNQRKILTRSGAQVPHIHFAAGGGVRSRLKHSVSLSCGVCSFRKPPPDHGVICVIQLDFPHPIPDVQVLMDHQCGKAVGDLSDRIPVGEGRRDCCHAN